MIRKIPPVRTLVRDQGMLYFASKTISDRLADLLKEKDGVMAGKDIEFVHRMRVASRRLRRILAVFELCFPPKQFNPWIKCVKKITRTLGAARDADVQLEYLKNVIPTIKDKPAQKGIFRLMLRLRQKRSAEQEEITALLDKYERSGVFRDMNHDLSAIKVETSLRGKPEPSPMLKRSGRDNIMKRLAGLLLYEPHVQHEDHAVELHEMRIAAKFLRYEMEIFSPLFTGKLQDYITAVRNIQDLLGELHDCDVWLEFLPVFLHDEEELTFSYFGHKRGFGKIKKGVEMLLAERKATRHRVYLAFVKFWQELKDTGLLLTLPDILDNMVLSDKKPKEKMK